MRRSFPPGVLAASVAVLAAFTLPALRANVPLTSGAEWTLAALVGDAVHAGNGATNHHEQLSHILRQARQVDEQLGSPRSMNAAVILGGLIPIAAGLALVCALLSLGLQFVHRRRAQIWAASAGLAGALYCIAAGWWITHVLRAQATYALTRATSLLHGALAGVNLADAGSGLVQQLGIVPEIGLFVTALAFVAILVLPGVPAGEP